MLISFPIPYDLPDFLFQWSYGPEKLVDTFKLGKSGFNNLKVMRRAFVFSHEIAKVLHMSSRIYDDKRHFIREFYEGIILRHTPPVTVFCIIQAYPKARNLDCLLSIGYV